LASFIVSVPFPGGRPVPGSVLDDTVSTDGPVTVTAFPGAFLTLMVSFPLMRVIGVAWRRGAWHPATRTDPGGAGVPAGIVLS
jgi:hypothetical protein